jgi:group I intron endonuclease
MIGIIYKVTCTINGKIYIGQTIRSLQERQRQHLSDARGKSKDFPFYRAIRKYGEAAFTWEQIDTAATTDELDQKEIHWIDRSHSLLTEQGYNCVPGGQNGHGIPQEIRDKISLSRSGQKLSLESIEKIKIANTGKTRSQEAKQHYVERWTKEERQKRREKYLGEDNPNYGNHMSEESRLNISKKAKARGGRPQTEAEKKKRSDSIRAWHAQRKQLLIEQSTN